MTFKHTLLFVTAAAFSMAGISRALAVPVLPDAYVGSDAGNGFGALHAESCGGSDGHGGTIYECSVDVTSSYNNGNMTLGMTGTSVPEQGIGVFRAIGAYWFEVIAPTDRSIAIDFATSATTSAGQTSFARADVNIFGSDLIARSCDLASSLRGLYCGGPTFPASFSGTYPFTISTNTPYEVLDEINLDELTSASAFIDPMITIDPGFLSDNPGDYSLIFSTNSGGVVPSGVPEPATLAMVLAGLGGLGFTMRGSRRKRSVAV